jgi:hypothetical protein
MREMKNVQRILIGKPQGYYTDRDLEWSLILKFKIWKYGVKVGTGINWLRIGSKDGFL